MEYFQKDYKPNGCHPLPFLLFFSVSLPSSLASKIKKMIRERNVPGRKLSLVGGQESSLICRKFYKFPCDHSIFLFSHTKKCNIYKCLKFEK